MKENFSYDNKEDLTKFEKDLFEVIKDYLNRNDDSSISDEKILEEIKRAFKHDTKRIYK